MAQPKDRKVVRSSTTRGLTDDQRKDLGILGVDWKRPAILDASYDHAWTQITEIIPFITPYRFLGSVVLCARLQKDIDDLADDPARPFRRSAKVTAQRRQAYAALESALARLDARIVNDLTAKSSAVHVHSDVLDEPNTEPPART